MYHVYIYENKPIYSEYALYKRRLLIPVIIAHRKLTAMDTLSTNTNKCAVC